MVLAAPLAAVPQGVTDFQFVNNLLRSLGRAIRSDAVSHAVIIVNRNGMAVIIAHAVSASHATIIWAVQILRTFLRQCRCPILCQSVQQLIALHKSSSGSCPGDPREVSAPYGLA
eukprot:1366107-Pyramimonas_sp.AAC.1